MPVCAAAVASSHEGVAVAIGEGSPRHRPANGADAPPVASLDSKPSMTEKKLAYQDEVGQFYNSTPVQVGVAFLIGANFLTNIVEKQIDPGGNRYNEIFAAFDLGYNVAFTLELGINIYAHWFCVFWKSSWNVFDAVVVTIGVVNMLKLPLPKPLKLLRMMRAFRVFRLFKRIKSLNKIIVAIVHAVPGVMNAFLILTIIMCIYAILGIEFFKDVGMDCKDVDVNGTSLAHHPGYMSIRKFCFGEEYFGSFSRSIFTFFQVLTGESWSEMVARPAIWAFHDDWVRAAGAALYFVSFVLISCFILTNVVVAVLLDKMSANSQESEEEAGTDEKPEMTAAPVVTPVPLTIREADAYRQAQELGGSLEKFTAKTSSMQSDFTSMKSDMACMKEQLNAIAKMVERSKTTTQVGTNVVGDKVLVSI